MKALYIIWPDLEKIEQCIEAGIDTLLVANQCLIPEEDQELNHWGSYKDTIKVLEHFKGNVKVKKILVPLIVPFWKDLPEKYQLLYKGKIYKRTPDPTSSYFSDRIDIANTLAEKYSVEEDIVEVVWDCEMYTMNENSVPFTNDYCSPKYCSDKQANIEAYKQWSKAIANPISDSTKNISGCLGNLNPWWLSLFENRQNVSHGFVETTYPLYRDLTKKLKFKWNLIKKIVSLIVLKKIYRKQYGNLKLYAGLWPERFKTPSDFFKYSKRVMKSNVFEGYWIYSQCRLSRFDHMDEEIENKYKPYYWDDFGEDFFTELKKFNGI